MDRHTGILSAMSNTDNKREHFYGSLDIPAEAKQVQYEWVKLVCLFRKSKIVLVPGISAN